MSFWGKLGGFFKKAAPIAAAFIPGVGPVASTLLAAGTGAATGAMGGGGAKGALNGALGGAAAGAGVNAARSNGGSFLDKITSGLTGKDATGGGSAGGAGGFLNTLLNGDVLNSIGRGTGAVANTEAHNRGVALDAMMAADTMGLQNSNERRAEQADLLKQFQRVNYLKNGGNPNTDPGVSANGKPFTKFNFGLAPVSDADKATAVNMEKLLMDRMNNPVKMHDYDSKMDPGKMERAMGIVSPILTSIGAIQTARHPQVSPLAARVNPKPMPTPMPPATPIYDPEYDDGQ